MGDRILSDLVPKSNIFVVRKLLNGARPSGGCTLVAFDDMATKNYIVVGNSSTGQAIAPTRKSYDQGELMRR